MRPDLSFLAFDRFQLEFRTSLSRVFDTIDHKYESTCPLSWFSSVKCSNLRWCWHGNWNFTRQKYSLRLGNHFLVLDQSPVIVLQMWSHNLLRKLDIKACQASMHWTQNRQRMVIETCKKCEIHAPFPSESYTRVIVFTINLMNNNVLKNSYYCYVISNLFHLAQVQSILVVSSELHKSHIRTLWKFRNATNVGEESVPELKWEMEDITSMEILIPLELTHIHITPTKHTWTSFARRQSCCNHLTYLPPLNLIFLY